MKNSETRPGTVFFLFKDEANFFKSFQCPPPPPLLSSPLPLGRGMVKSSPLSPRGLLISSTQHFFPHGNMSGVIGGLRQSYSTSLSCSILGHADRKGRLITGRLTQLQGSACDTYLTDAQLLDMNITAAPGSATARHEIGEISQSLHSVFNVPAPSNKTPVVLTTQSEEVIRACTSAVKTFGLFPPTV